MDIKPYKNPNEEGDGGFVSESVAAYPSYDQRLDVLKHQVMEAVSTSEDKVSLLLCLNMLTNKKSKRHHVSEGKSDEELAAILSSSSDWEDMKHADLSQVDYGKYKPYQSSHIKKTIEKWL